MQTVAKPFNEDFSRAVSPAKKIKQDSVTVMGEDAASGEVTFQPRPYKEGKIDKDLGKELSRRRAQAVQGTLQGADQAEGRLVSWCRVGKREKYS